MKQSDLSADIDQSTIHQSIIEMALHFHIFQDLPLTRGIYPRMDNVLYCWLIEQRITLSSNALGRR